MFQGVPATILVVDDEPSLGPLAARMLEQAGYVVIQLRSPPVALKLLTGASPYDLLIADVRMPEMSGFELARYARVQRPALPVLFVSGFVEPGYAGEGGFHDFLAKPFTQEQLVEAVRRILDTPDQASA